MLKRIVLIALTGTALAACGGLVGGGSPGDTPDSGVDSGDDPFYLDSGPAPQKPDSAQYTGDAFFADDPPPQYCGPTGGGGNPPPLPGGTPECPDDKNREGCPCATEGEKAACWPGKRVNRARGICKDGVTTCRKEGELHLRWGPCEGYVLPTPGVTKGPGACTCFSNGSWAIKNLSPCFVNYPGGTYVVSTYLDGAGQAQCPAIAPNPPPQPQPGVDWSENKLLVDCAGQMKLCYTIKAGDPKNPAPTDCVIAESCTSAWYAKKNTPQTLPPLPSWSSTDTACAAKFESVGGYGEMSVVGESVECQAIDDNGKPLVFHRVTYCPLKCAQNPALPGCEGCGNGASGSF